MTGMAPEKPLAASIVALADLWVQWGLCLPVCPTYALDARETESPRGRIALARAAATGELAITADNRLPLDHCLGCLACERVCPAQVRYDALLLQTRALLGPSPRRPHRLLALLKHPRLLRLLRRSLGRWRPPAMLRKHLPSPVLRAALDLVPRQPPGKPLRTRRVAAARVAIFPGCVASVEDADAQRALWTLLQSCGIAASVLPALCCGALDAHDGDAAHAEAAAERVRRAWRESGASELICITPGCLDMLRAALPDVPVNDGWALLTAHAGHWRLRPLHARVMLHVPCTQRHVARSDAAMRALLERIPGLSIETLGTHTCCGAAGSHVLTFPERAAQLRAPLRRQLAERAPALLLSSNIGCRLHLGAGDAALPPSLHPLILLARQLEPSPGVRP